MGQFFDKNRGYVMLFAAFVSFFAMILTLIAMLAISTKNQTVKDTAWTIGTINGGGEIWVGLSEVIFSVNGGEQSIKWKSQDCEFDYCRDCKDACDSTYNAVIISLITCLPQLLTDIQRSTRRGDLNCQKVMGVVTGILGTLSSLSSLSAYADGCIHNLPTYDATGASISYHFGPGFACLLLATLLKPIDVFVHLVTPVVHDEDGLSSKEDSMA